MRSPDKPYQTIPWYSHLLRNVAGSVATLLLPTEVISPEDGLLKIRKLAKEGWGTFFYSTHPTQGEIVREIAMIGTDPVLGDRETIIPESPEHYAPWHTTRGRWAHISVYSVPTRDSMEYFATPPNKEDKKQTARYERKLATYTQILKEVGEEYIKYLKGLPEDDLRRKKLPEYKLDPTKAGQKGLSKILLDSEVRALDRGGNVLTYVQGGRRPYLGAIMPAVSMLVEAANQVNVTKYTLTALGVEIEDVEDYGDEDITGYNYRRKYFLRMGKSDSSEDFQQEAEDRELTLDQLALERLGLVIPPSYRPKDTEKLILAR